MATTTTTTTTTTTKKKKKTLARKTTQNAEAAPRKKATAKKAPAKKATATASSTKPRIYGMSFASVYPLYVQKAEKKGRTKAEVDEVIGWLTGYRGARLDDVIARKVDFETFFAKARLNPNAHLVTGVVCGVRVEDVEDPLMQKIRWLDKLVDELARGKAMAAILRRPAAR